MMLMKNKKALAAFIVVCSVPAAANTVGGLEEIIVTAQKRAETLQNVPIAVTALSEEALAAANIEAALSLSKVTPSLIVTVNNTNASAYLRGVGSQFANVGLESSVAIYFDDMYMPRASSAMFSLNDIERVEVLKGPQGTLYGRNATGGAIRIISADPKHKFETQAALTYGTDERVAVDGLVNLPIAEGLALRVAYRHDENNGYVRNVGVGGPKKINDRDEDFWRAKLLFDAIDRLTVRWSADYLKKKDTDGFAFTNLFDGLPEQIPAASGGSVARSFYTTSTNLRNIGTDTKNWGTSLRIDYDFDSVSLSSITSYRDEDQQTYGDLDATDADFQQANFRQATEQLTQEFQAISDLSGRWNYVTGLYLLREKARAPFGIFGSAVGSNVFFGSDGEILTTSIGPYGQVDYTINDQLAVTVGARYTKEKKKLEYSHGLTGFTVAGEFPRNPIIAPTGPCTTAGQILCSAPGTTLDFNEFTPEVIFSYTPTDATLLYVSYSRGFKSGGLNLPAFGTVDEVDPEILDAYEIGWKTEVGNVRFNGAAFYYDYKDLQQQITDQTTGGTRAVNAANASIYGLESDVLWAVTANLELAGGFGWLRTKYDDYIGDAYVPCGEVPTDAGCIAQGGLGLALLPGQDFGGNPLVNAPKFTGYLRGSYYQPLPNDMGSLDFSMIVNYRSKTYYDPAKLFEEPSRTMLSANLTWRSPAETYFVSLYGENLTGREYHTIKSPQATGGWQIQGPPRQVYIKAGFKF